MPELPDLTLYVEALRERVVGARLVRVRVGGWNLLRTAVPESSAAHGREVERVGRQGKRIVLSLAGDLHLAIHLMVLGRLQWLPPDAPLPRKQGLAAFDFAHGTLRLTESGSKQRASLHVLEGAAALAALDAGGLEPLDADADSFRDRLRSEDHTLKRALTDPRLFAGIGNAYSDEILHAAGLSPLQRTPHLTREEIERLHEAVVRVLTAWTTRLRDEAGGEFPAHVTAFRPGMAAHGRFRQPCPVCASPIQRIVYADRETNYCARCQTQGRLLADRALSRLLRKDWPRSIEELEER